MFQLDWFDGNNKVIDVSEIKPYDKSKIEKIQYTFWAEHCLECAPPECFSTCEYYEKRVDGHCKRTIHGQQPVKIPDSILGQGSYFVFRPWAKIETYIYNRFITVGDYEEENEQYRKKISKLDALKAINVNRFFNNVGYYFTTRNKYRTQELPQDTTDFLLELFSLYDTSYKMIIEAADIDWKVISRNSVDVKPGFNSFLLDYKKIAPEKSNVVRFYPENSLQAEVLIVNADFVVLKQTEKAKHAKTVKCVAWDLDNTLWNGILSETENADSLCLRPGIKELILDLDRRGVIQTIVSKNDFEPAWKQIMRLGLSEYFLYPAINWGQKSNNLKTIAKELNINIDTFAMIDDSDFERREISSSLPQVRVYDENIVSSILSLPEFNLPITEEAAHRREMYQTESKRKKIQASYGSDYLDFIRSCEMVIEIGKADQNAHEGVYDRCYELVSRTNQLNISGHKYSRDDFQKHYLDNEKEHIYFSSHDKFGSYGIVGYVSFRVEGKRIDIDELAVSCRVAQKHVEYTVLSWIAREFAPNGQIIIKFIKTGKNMPMFNALTEIGFKETENGMIIQCEKIFQDDSVIKVVCL